MIVYRTIRKELLYYMKDILTQRLLIKDGCSRKGITMKTMCNDLDFNYEGFYTNLGRNRLTSTRVLKIVDYLDLDLRTLMDAPIEKDLKKKVRKNNG